MTDEILFTDTLHTTSKRIAWATDLHLDAAAKAQHIQFCELVNRTKPDVVLLGGDICNGQNALQYLKYLAANISKPIYFVLGNHDYYYGSIHAIRTMAKNLFGESSLLHYLTETGVIELSETTALIGHDGWYDGRVGNFLNSTVLLNDYFLIEELKDLTVKDRLQKLNELGDEAAFYLKETLKKAFERYQRVVLLTHVPPFRQACFYEGKVCDDNWAPHFVSQALGEALLGVMEGKPNGQLLVLCGHSHSHADTQILPNLHVVTGDAELGNPTVQGLIFVN